MTFEMKVFENFYDHIEQELNILGYSYKTPSQLSKAVIKTSEYFISRQGASPWENKDFAAAYIAHFLPMNIFRWFKVFDRIEPLNFLQFKNFYDFGAGPLTFKLAYALKFQCFDIHYKFEEPHLNPTKIGDQLYKSLARSIKDFSENVTANKGDSDTLILSYALNELKDIPKTFWDFKNILILEPSSQKISRQLMTFKEISKEHKFLPMAPCTHSDKCPLLYKSKKDWCFDRTTIQLPKISHELYKILPFDSINLTFSYLWLSRTPSILEPGLFRTVGDWQNEKGKKKIMICRSSQREFLSLLDRNEHHQLNPNLNFERGDLNQLDIPYEIKGQEIRIK